jgi:hypothetical protein
MVAARGACSEPPLEKRTPVRAVEREHAGPVEHHHENAVSGEPAVKSAAALRDAGRSVESTLEERGEAQRKEGNEFGERSVPETHAVPPALPARDDGELRKQYRYYGGEIGAQGIATCFPQPDNRCSKDRCPYEKPFLEADQHVQWFGR